jgi:hypothetical protein
MLVQLANARVPIVLKPSPIIRLSIDEHPEKAQSPIDITLFGITNLLKPEHPLKAY